MTPRKIVDRLTAAAMPLYGSAEARQIAFMILEARTGIDITKFVTQPDVQVVIDDLEHMADEIGRGRPVQYVLGGAEFCGMKFEVGEGVLIPRPETEELVRRIVDSRPASLLDIGTGSGCIAISVAALSPETEVWATDISAKALEYARRNAANAGTKITFMQDDALSGTDAGRQFDAVVSNPPYIPRSEAAGMRINVVDYEPHTALFVDDDDPLVFYRAIARSARRLLTEGGRLWFEIHERFADEVVRLIENEGFVGVEYFDDINGKPRIVCGRKA